MTSIKKSAHPCKGRKVIHPLYGTEYIFDNPVPAEECSKNCDTCKGPKKRRRVNDRIRKRSERNGS